MAIEKESEIIVEKWEIVGSRKTTYANNVLLERVSLIFIFTNQLKAMYHVSRRMSI